MINGRSQVTKGNTESGNRGGGGFHRSLLTALRGGSLSGHVTHDPITAPGVSQRWQRLRLLRTTRSSLFVWAVTLPGASARKQPVIRPATHAKNFSSVKTRGDRVASEDGMAGHVPGGLPGGEGIRSKPVNKREDWGQLV